MFLVSLFMRFGLGARAAKILSVVLVVALVVGAIWWLRHDAYRDGVKDTDARWEEAGRRLEKQAERAAGRADSESEERVQEFNERQAREKERLDEAAENGTSPLDVLFGG